MRTPRAGLLRTLGPGLMFAGTAVGVSHLVQSTRAGAGFGLTLLWLVLLANLIKYPAFEAGARYAAGTGHSLLEGYRRRGRWALVVYLGVTLLTMCIVLAAVTAVTAGMLALLVSTALGGLAWSAALLVVCAGILVIGRFRALEWIMKGLMLVLTLSTVVAVVAILPRADLSRLALLPVLPELTLANLGFMAALVGWMPSAIDIAVWQSLWGLEKARTESRQIEPKEALLDFNVGYLACVVLAVGFVILGAAVLHTPEITISPTIKAHEFAKLLVDVYAQALGAWARPVILIAAFATMFSTTLSVLDGFPRALETAIARLGSPEQAPTPRGAPYWVAMAVCAAGALAIIGWMAGSLTLLVDVATVTSFLTAPVLAFLNLRAVTGAEVPASARPGPGLLGLHWFGLVAMTAFALGYVGLRLWGWFG